MQAARTRVLIASVFAFALASVPASANGTQEKKEVNLGFFGVSTNIDARELGLPVYPGATVHRKAQDEDSSAKVWAGLGNFGFKVVAIELDSPDAPAKIAAWYRPMLNRFGAVLDCSYGAPKAPAMDEDFMNCKNDHPAAGGFLFKAGRKYDMHVVGVEREGAGTKIALVYVSLRGIGN